jgi:ATP-dependent RNA helicase DDX5/DBP2
MAMRSRAFRLDDRGVTFASIFLCRADFMSALFLESNGNSPSVSNNPEQIDSRPESDAVVIVSGDDCPSAYTSFTEAPFPQCILAELIQSGFIKPTPVQTLGWPIAMAGRDVIGIARTGSGKTLAYVLPMITQILQKTAFDISSPTPGPFGLVLAPTRELALQIQRESDRFAAIVNLRVTCCYGGAPRSPQLRDMTQGFEICIATPGRLIDFVNSKPSLLDRVICLVLDEADRMLDMGFGPQIQTILSHTPTEKHSSLWSATFPKDIRQLAYGVVCNPTRNPIHFVVGSDALTVNPEIQQTVQFIESEEEKRSDLIRLLDDGCRAIIFATTKVTCEFLCRELRYENFNALAIHGDKHQSERDSVISEFRKGNCSLLIATDVASRGLDIKDVPLIINYEMPTQMQDFVHRVGRTSRLGGSRGRAHTYITPGEGRFAKPLIKILQDAKQEIPDTLLKLASDYSNGKITYNGKKSSRSSVFSGSNTIPLRGNRTSRKGSFDVSTASSSGDESNTNSVPSRDDFLFAIDHYDSRKCLVEFVDRSSNKHDSRARSRSRNRF